MKVNFSDYNVMLDSGAYSFYAESVKTKQAVTKNSTFKKYLNNYIAFCDKYKSCITYVNLDIIGNAKLTLEIQREMEKNGLTPIPVFHMDEDAKYLKKYLDNYEYIGLGGSINPKSKVFNNYVKWADDIFRDYICNPNGTPRVKIHGFGMTAYRLMIRYPWWSVDSAAWCKFGMYGVILYPMKSKGYKEIGISEKSPKQEQFGKHFDNLSSFEQKQLLQHFKDTGFDFEKLKTDHIERVLYNTMYYCGLENKTEIKKFKYSNLVGFGSKKGLPDKQENITNLKVYLAGMTNGIDQEEIMYKRCGVRNRLYSYFYIGDDKRCKSKKSSVEAFKTICGSKIKETLK